MKEPILVIMAAGMGSRFGGLKQMTPIDPEGRAIIDYSLFDAHRAGFRRVVFVIKHAIERDFRDFIGTRMEKRFEVQYVFQELDELPEGFTVPESRAKPWGTGHAVACCRRAVDAPFAVINADDFYGADAYRVIYDYLKNRTDDNEHAMVGYRLRDTVTESGYVSRGVCETENGLLRGITERTHIEKRPGGIVYIENGAERPLSPDTTVSMNFWGFGEKVCEMLWADFAAFLRDEMPKNPEKAEFYLPSIAEKLLKTGCGRIRVLASCDRWHGVTYREDLPEVVSAVEKMKKEGKYPQKLWID